MKQVLLDTSFVLSATREKIDFFSELREMGFVIIIPKEVINELTSISLSKQKLKFRDGAKTSLNALDKEDFDSISLKSKNVDSGIVKFLKNNPSVFLATLDKELSNKIKNKKIILRKRKKLEVIY